MDVQKALGNTKAQKMAVGLLLDKDISG